jgi:hypothetical protein
MVAKVHGGLSRYLIWTVIKYVANSSRGGYEHV